MTLLIEGTLFWRVLEMGMTKFECAVDYTWDLASIGDSSQYITTCMNTGLEAIRLLKEFYENADSMGVPSEYLMNRAQKLLEEWD